MVNNFKIKNEKQLNQLKRLKLDKIIYDTDKSDTQPLPPQKREAEVASPSPEELALEQQMREEKEARIKKLKERRISLNRCEKEYTKTVNAVRNVMQKLMSQPAEAINTADEVIVDLVETLKQDQSASMHLVNMKGKSESSYYHAINVTILALMLGKFLDLNEHQMHCLGLGAMFHDLGHNDIPDKILRKTEPLNKAETELYQMHPRYGVRMAQKIGTFPPEAITIIEQHHEMADGSGFPNGLKCGEINHLAKIVAIVNSYDNLCNKIDADASSTPYEAISTLFAKEKHKYDMEILTTFITQVGVYPPGTVVQLSDERIAAVMSINSEDLLSPNVMIYDPQIPSDEALIVNLKEEELSISKSLKRSDLSDEILIYLNLGDSVNFYIAPGTNKSS